jgi:hypothetical protein
MLPPQAVSAAQVFLEKPNHGAKRMHHQAASHQSGRVGEPVGELR